MKFCSNVSIVFQIEEAQASAEVILTYQHFKLTAMQGEFTDSQIVLMLGEN
jgi:ATP-binding cassette subfamily E protein 1